MEFYKQRISLLTETDFEKDLLDAAFDSLEAQENPLRFNNFANGIRELSRHILRRLAPDEEVLACVWYRNEIKGRENGITRRQRVKFIMHGGISDEIVKGRLKIEIEDVLNHLGDAIELLNTHVHIEPETFGIDDLALERHVAMTSQAFLAIHQKIGEVRKDVERRLERRAHREIRKHTVHEHIDDLGELSTHYFVEDEEVDNVSLLEIGSKEMVFSVTGSFDVRQQFGSNRDVDDDTGLVLNEVLPFNAVIVSSVLTMPERDIEIRSIKVDSAPELSEDEIDRLSKE